ncbi:hypothetical protein TYRP_022658 [Tyrophagus putrescentiae]|nr:hypothetical protein TYRP_022658 [Tyrophagus putrescentiae]
MAAAPVPHHLFPLTIFPFGTSNHHHPHHQNPHQPHLTSSPFLYYMTKNGIQLPVSSAVSSFSSPSAFFPSSSSSFSSPSFGGGDHSDFADFSSFFPGFSSSPRH